VEVHYSNPMLSDVRVGLLLVAAAVAAGCGRAPEGAASGDTVHAVAAVPTTLTVTERGIGPLRAGMTLPEASAALGGALVMPTVVDTAGCRYVQWRGGPPGVRVMVEGGHIARVDVDTAGVRTAAGAGIGDSEVEVQRLYPGHVSVTPQKYTEGHYLTVTPNATDSSYAIVFETSGGKVTRFRAGRRPQVEYVEGCG
jgi:hypothetical protein